MIFRHFFLLSLSIFLGVFSPAAAQLPALTPEDEIAHKAEADLWLDLVFGYCLSQVAGEPWSDHPAELAGEWTDLRPDYASTLAAPLFDPKESVLRGSIIYDLSPGGESCWSQYSSLVPDYAVDQLIEVWEAMNAEDRLKTAVVDQGFGPQEVQVILVGQERVPVIFYQAEGMQGPLPTMITIIQKTLPGFVYND